MKSGTDKPKQDQEPGKAKTARLWFEFDGLFQALFKKRLCLLAPVLTGFSITTIMWSSMSFVLYSNEIMV